MTKAFGERRRAAFLRALAETGNRTIAAARAKVSRSWVTLHRAEDPGFRAAIESAVAEAKVALAAGGESRPVAGWQWQDGAELVVRGTNGRRVQVARARLRQWDPAAETLFLSTLSATCNVKAACAAVGLSAASAYNHRKRWPGFATRWKAAVEDGYARLEAELIMNAGAVMEGLELPEEAVTPPMTVDQVMQLLWMHQHQVRGIGGRPGRLPRRRTLEELKASLLKKAEMARRLHPDPPGAHAEEGDVLGSASGVWRGRAPGEGAAA